MRLGYRIAAAGMATLMVLSLGASAAFGYAGQVAQQITVAGPGGTLACNTVLTVTATVLTVGGVPVTGDPVVWTFGSGQLAGDQIITSPTNTNGSGVATTTVRLVCIAGARTIVATLAPASGQTVLNILPGGLPPTSTTETTPLWAYALAVLGLCVAGFVIGRRVLQGR